jgi:hydrogenase maturation protease
MRSFVSTHTVLSVRGGEFVSLLDPPASLREAAAQCRNVGTWPVMVGREGERDAMLSSPIILYDYPRVAPESAGDFFDGTEIDEMLALRVMTLTDEEKREMQNADERTRRILERTDTLPAEQMMKLHGAMRGLRQLKEEKR